MKNNIAAIVVTHNRKDCLLRCITALRGQTGAQADIVVVDNASTDGTAQAVATLVANKDITYLNTGANLGGAGGFNLGMRKAVEAGYAFLWVMDDDCIPDSDALAALLAAHRELAGNYGFLSSIAYWRDGTPCRMNVQKTGLMAKLTDYESPLSPVMMATFVSAFFPAARVREVGLPIRDFFIWSDDLEYTRRLSRKHPCYAVTGSRVLHAMHSNDRVDISTDSSERVDRYRYLYRNEVYVYRREGLQGWLYVFTRTAVHILRVLMHSPQKWEKIRIILSSFFAGFRFHPPVEQIEGKGDSE